MRYKREVTDSIVFALCFGAGAFPVAALTAFAAGRSPRRMLLATGVGLLALIACGVALAHAYGSAPDWDTCRETFGATADRLILFVFLPLNVLAWVAGATVGWVGNVVSSRGATR